MAAEGMCPRRIELPGSNVILEGMGRPRKFSRESVLEKALPVFWKYGFARTTLPDLELATGVNKSGLYSEFESKEEIFLACLGHYFDSRKGVELLSTEPLGWNNVEKFLEDGPSCALDHKGCFAVNSMRELASVPPQARKMIMEGRAKLGRLLRTNVAAENPKTDVDSVCGLVSVFFSGICIEANLNTGRSRSRQKIQNFMHLVRLA